MRPHELQELHCSIMRERLALHTPFRIARGTKTHADVVVVTLRDTNGSIGMGEAVPYARYDETVEGVLQELEAYCERGTTISIPSALNAFESARCALYVQDCEPFDIRQSARTLVIDTPEQMAHVALSMQAQQLKVKLQGDGLDLARVEAVHRARPEMPLWLDANEGWSVGDYQANVGKLRDLHVVLLEQPFAADNDIALESLARPIPVCADESYRPRSALHNLATLARRYDVVNLKLDKSGGPARAIEDAHAARVIGLEVAVGCMVSSSLSIAAAHHVVTQLSATQQCATQQCATSHAAMHIAFVDLDGATFLTTDRDLSQTGWDRRSSGG